MPVLTKVKQSKVVTADDVSNWFDKNDIDKRKVDIGEIKDETLALINDSINDPMFDGFDFINTCITYQGVLNGKGTTLQRYIEAIRFCSFLEIYEGNSTKAYISAFSHRDFIKNLDLSDTTSVDYRMVSASATRYRKSPIVVNILTQAEVPLYLLFQSYRYKAVETLVKEMQDAKLSKDRIQSANILLTHLKPPENVKIELDVGVKKDNVVDTYEQMLANMVAKQKELISQGESVSAVTNAKATYIDAEVVE